MSALIERTGDLFTTDAPALGHGVNVHGVMGHGIAPLFKRRHPAMYAEYRALCQMGRLRPGEVFSWDGPVTVYNLASQDRPGRHARLGWLASSVEAALADASTSGHDRIALPRVGCGIGGLDWADVRPLLADLAAQFPTDLEVWTLPARTR